MAVETLGDALPKEMARVREIYVIYRGLGVSGAIAAAGMKCDLDEAARALASADVVAMLRIWEQLKTWEV